MTPDLPDARRIRELLRTPMWDPLEVVPTTGSTNADLAERARDGAREGAVLIASEQTAGKGRLDRHWVSPAGSSMSMSLLLRPRPPFPQWGWLSLLAGMAVAAALTDLASSPTSVTLKWPNDVLIDGKKVCGILSERVEQPDGARAVIGIGLNVSLTQPELPVPGATSLLLEGMPTDQSALAATVLDNLAELYRRWQFSGSLRSEYESRCASIGAALTIQIDPHRRVVGAGRGVDEFGRLQVATAGGIETFAVGDVVHAKLGG